MEYIFLWLILVLNNWKVITNLLVKAVTQDLFFSGVTAFNALSADSESRLKPRSAEVSLYSLPWRKLANWLEVKIIVVHLSY